MSEEQLPPNTHEPKGMGEPSIEAPQGEEMSSIPLFVEKSFQEIGAIKEGDLLKKARIKAYDRFLEIGFPSRKDEHFQYVRFLDALHAHNEEVSSLLATEGDIEEIKKEIYPESDSSYIVFINGYFRPDLSKTQALAGITLQPIAQAARSFNALLSSSWSRNIKDEADPLSLLAYSLSQDGLFLYIPPNKKIEAPIQILYLYSDAEIPSWSMPRLHILLGHHAEATVVEKTICRSLDAELYINSQTVIEIEEGAHLHHSCVAFDESGSQVIHTHALRAYVKSNAHLESISFVAPQKGARFSYSVWLKGEGAHAAMNGAWTLSKNQEAHTHVHIQHDEPHCESMQLFKGVVQDSSRSSFEGKIYVHQRAQKTQAYQLNNNLILGDDAHAYSKPNLEIYADDVKASHGATSGQLDTESLFYLQTRGVPRRLAEKCLTEGFLSEVVSKITVKSLREHVKEYFHALMM